MTGGTKAGWRRAACLALFATTLTASACGAEGSAATGSTLRTDALAATPTATQTDPHDGAPSEPPAPPSPAAPASTPPTGTWERLDDLRVPLQRLSALELADGRVLVLDQGPNTVSDLGGPPYEPVRPELLDPVTRAWTPLEPLNAPRSEFVAVELVDGRVLVAGGDNGWYTAYSSAKLLDPATGRWKRTGLMVTARRSPIGARLQDGRVLVAGGIYSEGYRDMTAFDRGRRGPERELRSAELFDPTTGRWRATGSLHHAASAGKAFLLPDGRVLTVGRTCETYDPVTEQWTELGGCVDIPEGAAAVVLDDGSLLVVGGWREDAAVRDVWLFDPSDGVGLAVAPLPEPRAYAGAVRLADGRVLVAGGLGGETSGASASTFTFDPAAGAWTASIPMPFAVLPGSLLWTEAGVLVIGGTVPYDGPDVDVPSAGVGWTALFRPEPASR